MAGSLFFGTLTAIFAALLLSTGSLLALPLVILSGWLASVFWAGWSAEREQRRIRRQQARFFRETGIRPIHH